jgi:hypothetical protein
VLGLHVQMLEDEAGGQCCKLKSRRFGVV